MSFKRLFGKKRDEFYEPIIQEDDAQPIEEEEVKSEPVVSEKTHLSKDALAMWYKLFSDEENEVLRNLDWSNVEVHDIVQTFRRLINDFISTSDNRVRVSYVGYLTAYSFAQYNRVFKSIWTFNLSKSYYAFVSKMIQALYDICIIHNFNFYDVFVEIKDIPIRSVQSYNKVIEYRFDYSFGIFTSLWENSTSKCFFDKKEKNTDSIIKIFSEYFEEFLENSNSEDINALLQFSIRNKESISEDYAKKVAEVITNEFYEAGTYISLSSAIALGENVEYLLVPAYINCLNSIIYSMQKAHEAQDYILIDMYEQEMYEILMRIRTYQEYRSEDFKEYFEVNWEWLLKIMLNYFSGYIITTFSDLLQDYYGIKEEEIEDTILTHSLSIILDFNSGEISSMDDIMIKSVYRLLSNRVFYDTVNSINPALINSF